MSYNFRLPNITGATEKEQIAQLKAYIFYLVDELQFALNNLEAATNNTASQTTGTKKQTEET